MAPSSFKFTHARTHTRPARLYLRFACSEGRRCSSRSPDRARAARTERDRLGARARRNGRRCRRRLRTDARVASARESRDHAFVSVGRTPSRTERGESPLRSLRDKHRPRIRELRRGGAGWLGGRGEGGGGGHALYRSFPPNGILRPFLSPRNRARALAAAHSASSTMTLGRARESRCRAAGRLEDAAGDAPPVRSDDEDVHRVDQRRSWPTNGSAGRGRERVTANGGRTAVLRLVPSAQARRVGAVTAITLCHEVRPGAAAPSAL